MANDSDFDLIHGSPQPDLFGAESEVVYRPNLDKVRARLHKLLAEARVAQRNPWDTTTLSLYCTIFPQMSLFLPHEEGAQLRFEFEAELIRLGVLKPSKVA